MTIDEAIKINKEQGELVIVSKNPKWNAANKLGIEALKVMKAVRPYSNSNKSYYLPGETFD